MLKNYIITAINNLIKNKLYSAINIIGLAIGLAACMLIVLYVQNETSYDKHWEKGDRIYRVTTTLDRTGSNPNKMSVNSFLLLPALKEYFIEDIEAGSQTTNVWPTMYVDSKRFQQNIVCVEKDFLEIFELNILSGSMESVLENPRRLALSEEVAQKLFGRIDVVGEVVSIEAEGDNRDDYQVQAVYRQPKNSVLNLPAITWLPPGVYRGYWHGPFATTDYILLREGTDPARITDRLPAFTDQYVDISFLEAGPDVRPSERMSFQLQNIRDIYLHSPFEGNFNRGNPNTVLAFSAIAFLVLFIGCINFTILSTARATQRSREVAMRKTVGASRSQLIVQFLGESFCLVFLALVLAVALMELLLPVFESLVAKDLDFNYTDPSIWISLLTLLIMVSIIGGLYPAFILSHFRPADILKANRSIENQGSIRLRNLLVVFQFGISIALIIATSVIYIQVQYSLNRDPGFNRENLLIVDNLQNREVSPNRITLKQQVEKLPDVINTSLSGHQPMQRWGDSTHAFPFTLAGDSSGKHPMSMLFVDHDFFRTYQIRLLAGRDFDKNRDVSSGFPYQRVSEQERQRNVVINTSAARTLGFTNPEDAIGKTVSTSSYVGQIHHFSIIGVVADTQFFTLRNAGRAEVYIVTDDRINVLTVRYRGSSQAILTQVTAIWKSMMGDVPIATNYVDQNMAQEFSGEQVVAELLVGFSLLAIIIACLGLYGSTAFTVDRRIKEIGLRKVMGAKVKNIVSLLLWQFSKPVLIANVIAWPVAIFAMQSWLERFQYRFNSLLMIPICLVSGLIALVIAWFTVAGNTRRVAKSKPIKALRYE